MVRTWLVSLLLAASAWGQVAGSLSGTVSDSSGAPVAGAVVNVYLASGNSAIFTSKTNSAGLFTFTAVRPDSYDVAVEATGFARHVTRQVKVDPIRESNLGTIQLEVASVQQTVEVTADVLGVQLANSELSATITRAQIQNLPVLGRQVSNLFLTQAGVSSGRGPTVVNGMRTSMANVTLDGINVQDNFIRTNSLDFAPFRTTIEQISEMTVAVANASSAAGGGAAQISLNTRSGGNDFHGSLYWYNRNNKFSSNDWFNNRAGVDRPFLNLNQAGGALGGRIIRDKLFFFVNYEGFRQRQQSSTLRTTLTPDAKRGLFTYRNTAGALVQTNLLNTRQARVDPTIAGFLDQLPAPNTTDAGDGLNTGGYRFNARSNNNRDQLVYRGDYYLSSNHSFTGTYNYAKEITDRPTLGNFYTPVGPVSNDNRSHLLSLAWRWTARPNLTNEARGGFALAPGIFAVSGKNPDFLVDDLLFSTPQNLFLPQGRNTDTYSIQDNANWLKGRHDISFGFQSQLLRVVPYNDASIVPTYLVGISTANTTGFTAGDLPGVRAQDVTVANRLYSSLAGIITSASQNFNVRDRTSGFVPNYTNRRRFTYDTYAGYVQDRWKMNRKLTLTLGLRYEYWTPLDEKDGLFLLPGLINNNPIQTLLGNPTFDFAGGPTGRPYYNPSKKNFAPNFGFAWDVFGNGRTALRGGYSISYVNDDSITAIRNNINTNPGLQTTAQILNQTATLAARPTVPTPAYKVPRTQAENFAINRAAAMGLPDPNLTVPYAQQFSLGIQQEVGKGNFIEVRYVGNRGTKLLRAYDFNQVVVRENGFLDDFLRARNNAFLALASTGAFNPSFNANIPGSQRLPVFDQLASQGLLTNATVQGLIRSGEVGSLADTYFQSNLQGSVPFYRNQLALGTNTIANGGNSTYHGLQFDFRRRAARGLDMQFNYTYSKVLSDAIGDDQNRFEPFLDLANPKIERGRAPFDLTHAFKANGWYELPFGRDQRWQLHGVADKVLGGWIVSGIWTYTSGTPFSVFSERGTLNRGARSTFRNTATALVDKSALDAKVGRLVMTGNGPLFVDPSAIGTDGRGTSSDGSAAFNGQLFYNPGPGTVGALQRRMFSGPWNFDLDMAVLKRFHFGEKQYIEFRGEAFNALNTPSFWVGDESAAAGRFNINNTQFGRITGTFTGRRIMQFGLYYRF